MKEKFLTFDKKFLKQVRGTSVESTALANNLISTFEKI